MEKETITITPSPRIDYCGKCNAEHGYDCPLDAVPTITPNVNNSIVDLEPKNVGGRPSKLTEELIEQAQEYVDSCEDEEEQIVKQSNMEKGYEMYETKLRVNIPTVEGLAYELKINKDTIYAWCKGDTELHHKFSDVIDELKAKQAKMLIMHGLSGDYNPTIAKVLLTKHGYTDKQEIDVTTGGEKINASPAHIAVAQEYEDKLKGQL